MKIRQGSSYFRRDGKGTEADLSLPGVSAEPFPDERAAAGEELVSQKPV